MCHKHILFLVFVNLYFVFFIYIVYVYSTGIKKIISNNKNDNVNMICFVLGGGV